MIKTLVWEFSTTGVRSITGDIILNAVENIKIDRLQTTGVRNLEVNGNDIKTFQNNDDIVFDPNQSGKTHFLKNTRVTGNATATGNVTIPGNVTVGGNFDLGNQETDTVDFDFVKFTKDLVPRATTDLLNLGSATKKWNDINSGMADIGDINIDTNVITTKTFNNNFYTVSIEFIINSLSIDFSSATASAILSNSSLSALLFNIFLQKKMGRSPFLKFNDLRDI